MSPMGTPERAPLRVAVTGGAGFIGTHTVRLLLDRGDQVLVIDDLRHPCGQEIPAPAELLVADIASTAAGDALSDFHPDVVIHLAAQGGVTRSLRDPASDALNNVVGTVALLRSMVSAGCRRMVFASSGGAIYGRARRLPSLETDAAKPLSPYGAAKLAGEGYLGMFRRTFQLEFTAMRYGNVYGPFQDGTGEAGLVAITCNRLLRGLGPQITGDGGQTRDFVYVGDVARANVLAVDRPIQACVNIGTGRGSSVLDVVAVLSRLAGWTLSPLHVEGRPGEVRSNFLDASRAEARLGWRALTTLEEGLGATLATFSNSARPDQDPQIVNRFALTGGEGSSFGSARSGASPAPRSLAE